MMPLVTGPHSTIGILVIFPCSSPHCMLARCKTQDAVVAPGEGCGRGAAGGRHLRHRKTRWTVSAKAETAAGRYNMRVVEDRLAAIILALALGRPQVRAVLALQMWSRAGASSLPAAWSED